MKLCLAGEGRLVVHHRKGAMIEETYAVFAAWDFARSKRENLDRLREENFIGASSATWLRDVAKVLNRRFDPTAATAARRPRQERLRARRVEAAPALAHDARRVPVATSCRLALPRLRGGRVPGPAGGARRRTCAASASAAADIEHAWTETTIEAGRRGAAEDGGRLRPAARQRRQGVRARTTCRSGASSTSFTRCATSSRAPARSSRHPTGACS